MTKFRGPGDTWRKEKDKLRLDCWWEGADLDSKQFMFEGYENNRDTEDVPKGELKSEKFLDDWWNNLELGNRRKHKGKKFIYWCVMDPLSPEEKDLILKHTQECLNEKLALLGKL